MLVAYSYPTGFLGEPRPMLGVRVAGSPEIVSLVDSGALGIRMPLDVATRYGVDISDASIEHIRIGGAALMGYTVTDVDIQVRNWNWKAPVTFINNLPTPILGTRGFFDECQVRFRFRNGLFALTRTP